MQTLPDRRAFLAAAAVTAAAAHAADPKANPVTLIDTHQHLWDLSRFTLPWVKPGTPLGRSYLLAEYQKETAGTGISKTVYMEVDLDPKQQRAEAEFVQATTKTPGSGMVGGVVSGRPADDGFKEYVAFLKTLPAVKGLRQVLHGSTPAGYCLGEKFVAGIRLLGDHGYSFDLCMRMTDLLDAAKLIDACPGTRFVLDHCGNAPVHGPDGKAPDRTVWKRDIDAVAKRPNVIGKVSGLINTAKKGEWGPDDLAPIVNHVLAAFGPDRVVFGGDWPVCTLGGSIADWVSALKAIVANRPATEQAKLFSENATRFYKLP
ncbi:MAG: amidohydrolase family protein [Gemmataceae bacterium]